jgi:2-haloacid dehalogenase
MKYVAKPPLQLWFARVLRDAFAAQLAGVFAPFRDFAGYHLAALSPFEDASPEAAAKAVACAFSSAEPYADVGPALVKLDMGGIKVAALTNGSIDIATAVLHRAGVPGSAAVFDISEPLAWKPDATAYEFAVNALLLRKGEVMMVSAHPWDVHGALQAGLQAAYVRREGMPPYPSFLDAPTITVTSCMDLADRLLLGLNQPIE